jgi:hypothetical protein
VNSLSTSDGKSFFSGEDGFVEFARLPYEKRKKVLGGKPIEVPEVDEILEDVKKKATEHKGKEAKNGRKGKAEQ